MRIQRAMGKRAVDQGKEFTLLVDIYSAAEIDEFADHSYVDFDSRFYRLNLWVVPEWSAITSTVATWTMPTWKQRFELPVDVGSLSYDGTLSLELERMACPAAVPGTSAGNAVVGRAKVTVPEVGEVKGGRFGLVRVHGGECKAEGFVFLKMKLVKSERGYYYDN